MGACGCGEHADGFKLPGPDGLIYHLSFYPGCGYCDTGPGWLISRLPAEADDDFEMRREPDLIFYSYGLGTAGDEGFAALPTVDPEKLLPELKRLGIDEVDADEVSEAVRQAAWETYKPFLFERKDHGKDAASSSLTCAAASSCEIPSPISSRAIPGF